MQAHDTTHKETYNIPNIVFDKYMKLITASTFKVFLILIWFTWGWNKTHCKISLKQLACKTNLSIPTIIKSVYELERKGLVKVTRTSTRDIHALNEYELNPDTLLDTLPLGGDTEPAAAAILHLLPLPLPCHT